MSRIVFAAVNIRGQMDNLVIKHHTYVYGGRVFPGSQQIYVPLGVHIFGILITTAPKFFGILKILQYSGKQAYVGGQRKTSDGK